MGIDSCVSYVASRLHQQCHQQILQSSLNLFAVARLEYFLTILFMNLPKIRSNETSNTQHLLDLPRDGDSSPVFSQKANNQEKHGKTSIKSFCSVSPSQNSGKVVFLLKSDLLVSILDL
mmetsp:Transcript_4834/g.7079  ORF Transcript_4834/g.7079 Transcript_4834/m.7079 type:complete len:119 (-) Transcript_4834:388-744(-)